MVTTSYSLVKLKTRWNDLRRLLQPYLNYDYDRCLDLIMVGAGIRPFPGDEPWKRNCQILYRLLGLYQFIVALTKLGFNIKNLDDPEGLIASFMIVGAMTTIYTKTFILGHYDKIVRQSKTFVNSNFAHSGDPSYDATVRQNSTRMAGKVTFTIFTLLCCDQMMISVPTHARDRIFGIPEQFHVLGPWTFCVLREVFVFMAPVIWGCGLFCTSLTAIPLLMGLRRELMIVSRAYKTIEQQGQCQMMHDQNNMEGTSLKLPANKLNWKHFKQISGATVEQHVEVVRNIHLLQPLVSYTYAATYYSVMLLVSLVVFLVIRNGLSLVSLMLAATGSVLLLECYFWCRAVDSVQESIEMIADSVAALSSGLPYSVDSHAKYIEMRTSLMIIQLNASQSEWFSCGGIFSISVESFGNLCMIIYRFATFLLNFE